MGNSSSSKSAEPPKRLHPLVSNDEYGRLQEVYKSASEHSGGFGDWLIGKLGLPADDEGVVSRIFQGPHGTGAVEEAEFVNVVSTVVRGSTSDIRRKLFGTVRGESYKSDLESMFRLLFHASGWEAGADMSVLVRGLERFARKQVKIDAGLIAGPSSVNDVAPVEINFGTFNRWCNTHMPSLQDPIYRLFGSVFFDMEGKTSLAGMVQATARENIAASEVITQSTAFSLACLDARFQGGWDRLFSSSVDGLSFDALVKSTLSYDGPTFFAIKDTLGNCFGAVTSETWKESSQFYGKESSLLFGISPVFYVFRSRTDGSTPGTGNFQYLKSRGRTGAQGIGFGGDENKVRLWIDRNIEECTASESGLTYESGRLLGNTDETSFVPLVIEVWGLGGDEASKAQKEAREEHTKMQMDRRKVDRKQFANNAFDREFLLGKTFEASHQAEEHGFN